MAPATIIHVVGTGPNQGQGEREACLGVGGGHRVRRLRTPAQCGVVDVRRPTEPTITLLSMMTLCSLRRRKADPEIQPNS